MNFEYPQGATPLDSDEIIELIPLHITTQNQLNEFEAANIAKAEAWLFMGSNPEDFLTVEFAKLLHEKMFDDTWRWAGKFRITGKNIGVPAYKISSDLNNLMNDVRHQIIHSSFSFDEIAYRFHHRLVAIHPFPNGNGRHARLITDFLLTKAGKTRFSWGSQRLEAAGSVRNKYISALRCADKHDYIELAEFVRS